MELIADTTVKKMSPRQGYLAPYIQFPWNYDTALIGKSVSIYKVDGGFYLSMESNEIKQSDSKTTQLDSAISKSEQFIQKTQNKNTHALSNEKNTTSDNLNSKNKEFIQESNTYARDGSRTHESLRNWILSPAELATFVPSRPIVFSSVP